MHHKDTEAQRANLEQPDGCKRQFRLERLEIEIAFSDFSLCLCVSVVSPRLPLIFFLIPKEQSCPQTCRAVTPSSLESPTSARSPGPSRRDYTPPARSSLSRIKTSGWSRKRK